ncbi:MAG: ferrous iron transport protein A [Planctomycetaceae bacterium]|nr:ferrous iron transport protein A [Planctomycetaceae bacterium]
METLRLTELQPGQSGIVTGMCNSCRLATRLMELGVVPGATIEVLRKAPFGDPIQYRICGTVISMRSVEAACVKICQESTSGIQAAVVSAG